MLKVGITGGIGSGKSLVARMFQVLGIPVLNADDTAKYLMQHDEALMGSIRQVLERERAEHAREALLADLRQKYLTSLNEGVLDQVRFDSESLPVRAGMATSAHPAAAGSSIPEPSERGER